MGTIGAVAAGVRALAVAEVVGAADFKVGLGRPAPQIKEGSGALVAGISWLG